MTKYDFTTKINRKGQGSPKWNDMYNKKPDVSSDVVPLSVADMEFVTQPEIVEGLQKHLEEAVLGYTFANDDFKKAVVDWMKRRHDFEIEESWIVNTFGIIGALFNAVDKFTKEGDGVVIMTPVYYPFYNAISRQNRNIVKCPLIETDGYYTMDYELFDQLTQKPENKTLLFCSPHNPVGRVWKKEELEKLAEIIIKNDVLLLSDEIHFDLIMPGYKHTVFQTISEELADRTITMTAASKSFNLAGMTLSSIIIKNEKLRETFRAGLDERGVLVATALGFKATEIAYTKCEAWLDQCIEVINTNQNLLHDFFTQKYPQFPCRKIEGTYLQWVDFRALNMTKEELEHFMIHEAQLFLDEGYIFGEEGIGYERFNLAAPTKVLEDALSRLDAALKKLKK